MVCRCTAGRFLCVGSSDDDAICVARADAAAGLGEAADPDLSSTLCFLVVKLGSATGAAASSSDDDSANAATGMTSSSKRIFSALGSARSYLATLEALAGRPPRRRGLTSSSLSSSSSTGTSSSSSSSSSLGSMLLRFLLSCCVARRDSARGSWPWFLDSVEETRATAAAYVCEHRTNTQTKQAYAVATKAAF